MHVVVFLNSNWRSHIFLLLISVDRVHRPDAGQVPTLQESVSSYKQIIRYSPSFPLYFYRVYLHSQAFRHLAESSLQQNLRRVSWSCSRTCRILNFCDSNLWLSAYVALSLTSNASKNFFTTLRVCTYVSWYVEFSDLWHLVPQEIHWTLLQTTFPWLFPEAP